MINTIKISFILFFANIVFYSCSESTTIYHKEKVSIDSLELYNPFYSDTKTEGYKYSIVHYMNVSCPECLGQMKQWDAICKEFKKNLCNIQMVCFSDDYFEYFKYLCKQGTVPKVSFPFLLDTMNAFPKRNPIFVEPKVGKTILMNSKYEIILTGDILHNKNTLSEYKHAVLYN